MSIMILGALVIIAYSCGKYAIEFVVSPVKVKSSSAAIVSAAGGSIISISGSGFKDDRKQRVKLEYVTDTGATAVEIPGKIRSDTEIEVQVPPVTATSTSRIVTVRVSQSRGWFWHGSLSLLASPVLDLILLNPVRSPSSGGGTISIYCMGLPSVADLASVGLSGSFPVLVRFKSPRETVVVTGTAQARQGFVAAIIPPLKCPPLGEIDVWVDVAVDSQNFTERMQRRLIVFDEASVLPTVPYSVTDEWWDLRCKGELCDLEIQCLDGGLLRAHRVILAARSNQLESWLTTNPGTALIWPCSVPVAAFVLRYIYTGAVTLRPGDDSELGERAAVQLGAVRYMGQLWGLPALAELSEARLLDYATDFPCDDVDVSEKMEQLMHAGQFSDLRVVYGDSVLCQAHKLLFAARSPIFRVMFSSRSIFRENVQHILHLKEMAVDVATSFVEFICKGECAIDGENALGLLVVADRYQCISLKMYAAKHLALWMDAETCVPVLLASVLLNTPALAAPAARLVASCYKKDSLPEPMLALLKSDEMACRTVERADPSVSIPRFAMHSAMRSAVKAASGLFRRASSSPAAAPAQAEKQDDGCIML